MQDQLSQNDAGDVPPVDEPLSVAIARTIYEAEERNHDKPWFDPADDSNEPSDARVEALYAARMVEAQLTERGHIVPGVPPLALVLRDFKVTHDRLTLTMLALRILNMLAFTEVVTPESKPARQFIDDYLQGKNHGPAGEPMLWPGRLPGLANLLREWGFVPTIALPGQASFVAKAQPPVAVN